MSDQDQNFMAQAIRLARRGLGATWPNPSVGALLVRPGDPPEVIARGRTGLGGAPHGETVALGRAGAAAAGTTLYVSLEPCSHHGRTPPCVDAIVRAGVTRVVAAIEDPDPRVSGRGFAQLRAAGIAVETGLLAKEARAVVLGHILSVTENRPEITLKLAIGADGYVPVGDGRPRWVTGEQARAHAHLLRAQHDAILVGRGTMQGDDPLLTVRLPGLSERSPVRVILDSGLQTLPTARMLNDGPERPVWIFCSLEAPEQAAEKLDAQGADIIRVGRQDSGRLNLLAVVNELARRGITRLMIEGGPTVARAFLDADLIDECMIYRGALPAGEGALPLLGGASVEHIMRSSTFAQIEARMIGLDELSRFRRNRKAPAPSSRPRPCAGPRS